MSRILVDTSVWVDYFRGEEKAKVLDDYIDLNQICINDLILSELLPSLIMKEEFQLVEILETINRLSLTIDWRQIREFQLVNLKNGVNKVGIPDLIIYQNAISNNAELLSRDKHFNLMAEHINGSVIII